MKMRVSKSSLCIVLALSLIFSPLTSANPAYAATITVCHSTNGKNPIVVNVDSSSWDTAGHANHTYDYIDATGQCLGPDTSDKTAPTIAISYQDPVTGAPISGPFSTGTQIRIIGKFTDTSPIVYSTVKISISGADSLASTIMKVDTRDTTGYTFYWDHTVGTQIAANPATVTITGEDLPGNPGSKTSTYNISNTAPSVTLTSTSSASVNSAFTVTATFSQSVTGLTQGEITVTGGTASSLSGSGTTYTFTVTPSAGTVSVQIPAGVAQNSSNIGNAASNTLSRTYDNVAPTVSLTTSAPNPTNSAFTVTATFSESVTGLVLGGITVTGGTASSLSGSGTTYTFTVTPTAGTVSVQIQDRKSTRLNSSH